jgi:YegS/Rv2252/BmrU family lipid kinase
MVVINPAAGKPESVLSVLNDVFGAAGIAWDVAITHGPGDGLAAARRAAGKGYDLVAAYGGDGTVSEVASALAEGGPPMLLLPGGTGNALADELGIPSGLAEAAALAAVGTPTIRRVDLGRVGSRSFILRATMGVEVAMVKAATREMKDRYGWLAYVFAGLQAIQDAPVSTFTIAVDGHTHGCDGVAALVANSAATGVAGTRIAPDVDVSDGALDVFVVQAADLPGVLGSAKDTALGQQPRLMSRWRGAEIHIEASPAQAVLSDGEKAGRTPIDVTVVPGAVGVVVPEAPDPRS